VVSSHILPDLAGLADAVGIMEGGRMIHCGPLDAIAAQAARTTYVIEVRAHLERARRALCELGALLLGCDEPRPGVFEIELEGGPDAVAELVERLVLRGARVSHVAPRESALEAIYRRSAAARVA
jgi:ABC-type multidrug transport system ATPase subunit